MGYSPRHILSYLGVPTVSMRKGPERRYRAGLVGRDALERLVFREEGDGLVNVGVAFDVPLNMSVASDQVSGRRPNMTPICDDVERFGRDILGREAILVSDKGTHTHDEHSPDQKPP